MLFKHGLCHIYSEFKYLFCDTQGLLTKRLEEAISSRGAQLPKECRRRCYKKESVSSLTTEKNQLVLRIPA